MSNAKEPNRKGVESDYEVGYGKPPQQARFKPGQSGNPKGRRRVCVTSRRTSKPRSKPRLKVTRDGKPRKMSTQEAMLLRLRKRRSAVMPAHSIG